MKQLSLRHFIFGLLGISFVIAFHEFGHWIFCKIAGVATPTFSVGFGPTLIQFETLGTLFSLSLFPLGGYVEILGMRTAPLGFEAVSFITKPLAIKMMILLGGIFANIILGYGILIILNRYLSKKNSLRDEAIEDPAFQVKGAIGPIGIISLISRSSAYGLQFFALFLAIISLNLAIFNLIPLPILDGGQLLITLFESLSGRMIDPESYELLMTIALITIAFLFILATSKDIGRSLSR